MTEKMYMHNNFANEFLDDQLAWKAYYQAEIVEGFEELARTKGMHLVPGSIQEKHRETLVWIPLEEEPYRRLAPRTPFYEGYENAHMTGIIWTAQAE